MMKTLMMCVVILAVICLCAVGASADVTIDSFNGSAANWSMTNGNPGGGWFFDWNGSLAGEPCIGVESNFAGNTGVAVDTMTETGAWNLTGATSLFYYAWQAPTGVVDHDVITSGMGNGASYAVTFPSGQMGSGWCPCYSPGGPSTWTLTGGADDLGDVTSVTISEYSVNGSGANTDIYYLDLIAYGAAGGAVVPEPCSLLALGTGFLGLAGFMRRRRP